MPDPMDLVIAESMKDVDRTLIRENLRKTHQERIETLQQMIAFLDEVRTAGETMPRKEQERESS